MIVAEDGRQGRVAEPIRRPFVEDLIGPQELDEYGLPNKRHMACFATLLWLGEEGFIRFVDTIRQDALDQVTLTGRCFTLLVSPAPDVPEANGTEDDDLPAYVQLQQGSHIHRIQTALKARDSVAIRTAMGDLLDRDGREGRLGGGLPDDGVATDGGEEGVPRPDGHGEVEGRDHAHQAQHSGQGDEEDEQEHQDAGAPTDGEPELSPGVGAWGYWFAHGASLPDHSVTLRPP